MTDSDNPPEQPPPMMEVTRLLHAVQDSQDGASDELLGVVYEQLRKLADAKMRREPAGHTLQATALVHEAYLRLLGDDAQWENRRHFFGAAAQAMRRILVERFRRTSSQQRGGDLKRADIEPGELLANMQTGATKPDLIALDSALEKLEVRDPRMAQVVTMRFFAGLDVEQTAAALDVSPRTVKREWAVARAWLFKELEGS